MTKHDRLAAAPIFIIDLYSVFGCDVAHIFSLFLTVHRCPPRFNSDKNQVRRPPLLFILPRSSPGRVAAFDCIRQNLVLQDAGLNLEKFQRGRAMRAPRLHSKHRLALQLKEASLFDIGQTGPHDGDRLFSVLDRYLALPDVGSPSRILLVMFTGRDAAKCQDECEERCEQ
jgi:hypothetical protein